MDYKEKFTERARTYLNRIPDDEVIKIWSTEISSYFTELRQKIGNVKDPTYQCNASTSRSYIKMGGLELRFQTNNDNSSEEKNTISVMKLENGVSESLDLLVAKNGVLYSETTDKAFHVSFIEEYLTDVFGELLSL
ncbi:DUF3942 family protein [Evansella tamaricis]|uniref:DUF3942 family protein n=1 Tax=Evansella tamaricis TaxID=2069301 RepID=A0ABS6JFF6_9BACI|nr:DUF3942 family protein [Evansella tamaricis]MBU9712393.1 DUF3942 family protein [Evansella tamaricis]